MDTSVHLQYIGQIVKDKKLPASEIDFADMDGDGKADYIKANS